MTLTPEDEWMNIKISLNQYIIAVKYTLSQENAHRVCKVDMAAQMDLNWLQSDLLS